MKVLWISNSPFPEIAKAKKIKSEAQSWVLAAASALLEYNPNIQLAVASFYKENEIDKIDAGGITHYLLPDVLKKRIIKNKYWSDIIEDFKPDVVHIHGSEYLYSYSFINECGAENVVLSIQGLVSVIEQYYYGGISKFALLKALTLRDLIKFDTLFSQKRNMRKRGHMEINLIQAVSYVIGRTSWDRAHSLRINPNAHYYFCNESLRDEFYRNKWEINKCEKHSIFISQAHYPIKGMHQLVKALPLILRYYPETKVYVAGHNFFTHRGIRLSGYGKYINSMIKKYKLSKQFLFTGLLSANEMCHRFIQSNVFVCPSAIENSPNSVGEAQLLGVPCVASYVGGTPDMITHGETGLLYRYEDVELLATNICTLFADEKLALEISENSRNVALKRHNKENNAADLYNIYSDIISTESVQ